MHPVIERRAFPGSRIHFLGLGALILAGAGCSHLPFRPAQSGATVATVAGTSLTVPELESEVMRYADGYVSSVSHSADEAAKLAGTRDARVAALRWKLDQATAAYLDATGQNPVWNALDMVVLTTVSRMVLEDRSTGDPFGPAVEPLLTTYRRLEASAWGLADEFLTPGQHQELENLIAEWRQQNPHERSLGAVRFREFSLTLGKAAQPNRIKPTSIFSLLKIDPLAGLDPTTIAIEQTRELADRAVAYAERMPTLIRWQAELLTYQLAEQPDAKQLLGDASRASRSMAQIGDTAEGLPALVDEQRKAAIDQFFAGVSAEREAILKGMAAQEPRFRDLLGQTRETLNAGTGMANSLDATVKSLDAFIRYVSPPESKTAAAVAPAGKPFNVLDYGKSAGEVGGMARDLNELLRSVNQTAPQLANMSRQAGDDLKRVVDHAFWRGLILIGTLLVGSVMAALSYRALSRKLLAREERA